MIVRSPSPMTRLANPESNMRPAPRCDLRSRPSLKWLRTVLAIIAATITRICTVLPAQNAGKSAGPRPGLFQLGAVFYGLAMVWPSGAAHGSARALRWANPKGRPVSWPEEHTLARCAAAAPSEKPITCSTLIDRQRPLGRGLLPIAAVCAASLRRSRVQLAGWAGSFRGTSHVLTFDLDAMSGWVSRGMTTPTPISRGEFGIVGAGAGYWRCSTSMTSGATWFRSRGGHPDLPRGRRQVVDAGHEIGHHGWMHRRRPRSTREQERRG